MHADEIVRVVIKVVHKNLLLLTLLKSVLINGVNEVKEQVILTVNSILACKPPKQTISGFKNGTGRFQFWQQGCPTQLPVRGVRRFRPKDGLASSAC